ncbi:hypothetical protein [Streptomyces boncukensis]|uniref:Uncharacterized protein n=1 Tax=Streptomyces boncukensis TaxID=2711219 RepID=A0A6G4X3K2_9ACTN|nr:hypothetical protein [Streptomyces boncukensis]NGO71833.1 hypothetical protein [Streptomyces boncukensis]
MGLFRRQPDTAGRAWDQLPTDRAAAKRRKSHRNGGARKAARKGQEWEDADRRRERYGRR